jgi:hypothetical protein
MKFDLVRKQLAEVYSRAILTGFSVKQNEPVIGPIGARSLGDLKSASFSLKNHAYKDIYSELDRNEQYHMKLPDGALLLFQYRFDGKDDLLKHRLSYFPCPILPSAEEAPELYSRDDLYGDIILNRIVRFPIRFDFDPDNYRPIHHAHSHLTLGQFENCRIPATHPLSPNAFFLFICRNLYFLFYKKNQNVFDKKIFRCHADECITDAERRITSLAVRN